MVITWSLHVRLGRIHWRCKPTHNQLVVGIYHSRFLPTPNEVEDYDNNDEEEEEAKLDRDYTERLKGESLH